ncbi:hypothetical protein GCM10011391_32030 [Pullulanibacillus camelliae]|uniref:Uncharacterized protein n=1 Tax=Pullulanibacillus camelliae TaxID=1707096 RepID=A0A8J3DYU1_9BACL|nr:hypothetical protein [Pullulanibacillus camelliae]GGE50844.1 hypothetical protein GCM10011391_32030 [Pullulanibacillus camelliae]
MNDERQERLQKLLEEALKPVLIRLDAIENRLKEYKGCSYEKKD